MLMKTGVLWDTTGTDYVLMGYDLLITILWGYDLQITVFVDDCY